MYKASAIVVFGLSLSLSLSHSLSLSLSHSLSLSLFSLSLSLFSLSLCMRPCLLCCRNSCAFNLSCVGIDASSPPLWHFNARCKYNTLHIFFFFFFLLYFSFLFLTLFPGRFPYVRAPRAWRDRDEGENSPPTDCHLFGYRP